MKQYQPTAVRFMLPLACCLAAALAGCGRDTDAAGKTGGAPVPVRMGVAVQKDVATTIEAVGTVVPVNSVAVKSRVDGQIERVAVRDGAEVQRGDLLFHLDPRPFQVALDAALATLERDEALLVKAQDQLRRYSDVAAKGYVSADQLADVQANARSATATVAADRAAVAGARLNLEFTTLRSPIDGRAGRVLLQSGNMVKALDTQPLVTINQMDPVYVEFPVPERYVDDLRRAALQPKTTVELTASGSDGKAIERSGPLTFLDNSVDAPTGTLRLRATVENADRALWPGQYARVRVRVASEQPALVVPASAVNQGPEGAYVYVIGAGETAEQRPVVVARTDSDEAVIARGLAAGERIIVDGQSRVIPGGRVTAGGAAPEAQAKP